MRSIASGVALALAPVTAQAQDVASEDEDADRTAIVVTGDMAMARRADAIPTTVGATLIMAAGEQPV